MLAVASAATALEPVRIHRVSEKSFEDTVEQLEWGFGGYGIAVVARLDHRSLLDSKSQPLRKSGMFLIMSQAWGETIFENDPAAVLDMPLRLHVYEDEDAKTVVSYFQPSSVFKVYSNEALDTMGQELDAVLNALVHVATKE